MGRRRVGISPRRIILWNEADYQAARNRGDIRSSHLPAKERRELEDAGVVLGPVERTRPRIGTEIGELTVIGYEKHYSNGKYFGWRPVCECKCGNEQVFPLNAISGKKVDMCTGCSGIDYAPAKRKRYTSYEDIIFDTAHRSRLLNRIANIISRCDNPTAQNYKHYGGRGIRWRFKDRREFLEYLTTLDGWDQPDLELDRIDNEGNYESGNLRFVTKSKNMENRGSVIEMQKQIAELRSRLRHCKCGAAEKVHNPQ